jgi:CYTH domain-containing protein
MIEIEHKFLLDHLNDVDLSKLHYVNIQQGYLCKEPVVRVRISEQGNFIGVKGPGTVSRLELEYPIPLEDAKLLIALSPGKILKKRYFLPQGEHTWEIDVFEGDLAGLLLAEIELDSENEQFEKPDFIKRARDVTAEFGYTNASLAYKGIPQPDDGVRRCGDCEAPIGLCECN